MLVLLTYTGAGVPEETALDVDFNPKSIEQGLVSVWVGHPLHLRGVLRNGLQLEIRLNKTECAQIVHAVNEGAELGKREEQTPGIQPDGIRPALEPTEIATDLAASA